MVHIVNVPFWRIATAQPHNASAHRQVFQYKTWQDKWYVGRVVQGPGFESGDPWFTDPSPTFH